MPLPRAGETPTGQRPRRPSRTLYVLAVAAGLRQDELLGLKWIDVDIETKTLSVRRTLSAAKGGPTFTAPKSAKSRSRVTFTEGAADALKCHYHEQLQERATVGTEWRDNGPGVLFCRGTAHEPQQPP